MHINLHGSLEPSMAMPKRKYNTLRQGMGDCSTPQPKCTGGCAAHLMVDWVPKDEESLPDQADQAAAQALAPQVQLEGRDSIVRFLCRTATGSPERGREHVRLHAAEEEADSQTSIKEQPPHMAQTHQIYLQKQTVLQEGPKPTDPSHAQHQQLATTIRQSSTPPCHKPALHYFHP
ncbi:hypothetical protein NDU88_010036 [Pleurodeles waltl]|uniref:Uncharacterized protein n=1 Tax=Pleurodeles waltl TaxID=8319 RepID=A0AAV7QTA2_PLEWA|nr:hypothetical protein NDU88_010036 [Pleurodeles waltl]